MDTKGPIENITKVVSGVDKESDGFEAVYLMIPLFFILLSLASLVMQIVLLRWSKIPKRLLAKHEWKQKLEDETNFAAYIDAEEVISKSAKAALVDASQLRQDLQKDKNLDIEDKVKLQQQG